MIDMAGPQMAFDEYEARLSELRARLAAAESDRDELRRSLVPLVERSKGGGFYLPRYEDVERAAAIVARHAAVRGEEGKDGK